MKDGTKCGSIIELLSSEALLSLAGLEARWDQLSTKEREQAGYLVAHLFMSHSRTFRPEPPWQEMLQKQADLGAAGAAEALEHLRTRYD